jgi:hypothetical protein
VLNGAAQGEVFPITRSDAPLVRLGPARVADRGDTTDVASAIERIRVLRRANRLGPDLTIRPLIEEGRRC